MPKNHKNKHDKEIIVKSDNQMTENANDMSIKLRIVKDSDESLELSGIFGVESSKFISKYVFFYYPSRLIFEIGLKNYTLELESDFQDVLETRETLAYLYDEIISIDKIDPSDADDLLRMKKLLRYRKMKRLEKFYNSLTEFGLTTLHDFYWEDFHGEKKLPYPLQDRLLKIIPIILQIKSLFEKIIHEEFPTDIIAENLTQKLYN